MTNPIADIERARDAVRREAWAEAYDGLRSLDPSDLTPADLDGLADAAWWLSKVDESLTERQRAYSGFADAGDDARAATLAVRLGIEHFLREEPAVGAGWLMRAQRHLHGEDSVEHGFLAVVQATVARSSGDLDGGLALAEHALELGRALGHRDLVAMAVHTKGILLVARGSISEGVALLDEAMTSVVAGELSSYYTGVVYCNVIGICLELADLGRAGEWSEAARAWCESLPPESPYPGLCRVNRAEVASLRGLWTEAEEEASRACGELMRFNPLAAAGAFYETGDIRRRLGDVAGAEEAFARAHELGSDPQPGLALLRLAQGKADAALTALRLAVGAESGSRLQRARLLAALVEAAIGAGDLDAARPASDELEAIARDFGAPALEAAAAMARGSILLAEGDATGALERLRRSALIWQELKLPYEAARARMRFGVAVRAAGDEDGARLELRSALTVFERLGAAVDAEAAAELLGERRGLPRGLTAREAQVLRLVATGKTNRQIAEDLVLSEHTVARHLQNIFGKLDVPSRAAATAFAFEHDLA